MNLRKMILLFICSMAIIPLFMSSTNADELVAYYSFDDNTASDNSGNDCHGTVHGPIAVTGKVGNAFEFDGVDDHIKVPGYCLPTGNMPRTVVAWVYTFDNTIYEQPIIQYGNDDYGQGIRFQIENGNLALRTYGTTHFSVALDANTWYHVAFTYDGTNVITFYVNGDEVDIFYEQLNTQLGYYESCIGGGGPNGEYENFFGVIDEVRIYDYSLTSEEIYNLYIGDINPNVEPVGFWPFDESSGAFVEDVSNNANHGTATGTSIVPGCNYNAREYTSIMDYTTIGHIPAYEMDADFTVSARIRLNHVPSVEGKILVKYMSLSDTTGYEMSVGNDGRVWFQLGNPNANKVISTSILSPGICYHVVGVRRGNQMRIYVDCIFENSTPCVTYPLNNTADITIGKRAVVNNQGFPGVIDDIRLYNRALSDYEICETYPIDPDLIYIPTIHCYDPELIIPVRFKCQTPTATYQVGHCWESTDYELKNVSFAGTAVESWGFKGYIIDNENQNVLIYALVGQDFNYIMTGEDTVLAYLHFTNPFNTSVTVCILDPYISTDSLALALDTCTINGDGLLFGDTTTDPGPVPFYPYIAFDTSWAFSYPDYSYIPGDVNCDQAVNLIDILYLINYKYKNPPGPAPIPPSSGDVNADCDINLLDILYFIDYKYGTPAGPELLCGCVESSPLNKIGSTMQKYSDAPYGGSLSTEYAEGKTFINLDAADVIKGIEMEIRLPDISANVSCPIEGMQVYFRHESDLIKLALFDVNGQHQIDKGEIILLEIDGEAEIVSAFAGGQNAEPLYLEVGGNSGSPAQLPCKFALHQNHPNPFNPVTQISFELPVEAHVTLDVYNIMGQKVSTIADRRFAPGYHTVEWDGSSFASGVYFYRIQAGDAIETRKMMLLK